MRPAVAILPWGDAFEDFLETIDVSLGAFRDEMSGGWLFGYVDALAGAGVDATIICVSRTLSRPTHWRHRPTGAPLVMLPLTSGGRWLRRGRQAGSGAGPRGGLQRLCRTSARVLSPYAATPLRLLARELRRIGARAVVCQEYEYPRFDAVAALGRALGISVFASFQGGSGPGTRLERLVRPPAIRGCAGLIIGASGEAERVRRRYGVAPERIAQIFNPLDPTPWRAADREAGRRRLGLPVDALVVAWHGRVDLRIKGLDVLLDAWSALRRNADLVGLPQRRLLLLGTGRDAGGLHEIVQGADDILWVDEYLLDKRDIAPLLGAADVYAFPSRREGFPVAPLEAMACGLPVVCSDLPATADIFPRGEASGGLIVPPGEAQALAGALAALLGDRRRRLAVGAAARRRVEEAFAPPMVGAQLRRVLLQETAG